MITVAAYYLILVTVMSLWAFLAYGIDKRRARNGGRRISEKSLQLIALLGGWPGALTAQRMFRHKTRKASFQVVFWAVVTLHVGLVGCVVYLLWRR